MAKLIPERFPDDKDPSRRAEHEFYQACQTSLGDDWIVIHSQKYVGPRPSKGQHRGPGEADFVLLHRSHGVLVVEVKGGSIDVKEGSWRSTDARRQVNKIENPFDQAEEAARAIHGSLKRSLDDVRASKTVRHCVAFPAVSKRHVRAISTYGPAEIVILREDLDSLLSKVNGVVRYWGQSTRWSDADYAKVKNVLVPTIKTPGMSAQQHLDILRELDELTESQKRTIRQLTSSPKRLTITGGAGTGKTLLAMYRAEVLASEGKKVLYVCANVALARHLSSELQLNKPGLMPHLTIDTAPRFIAATARAGAYGDEFELRKEQLPKRDERYMDAITSGGLIDSLDCLILDEAQDIRKQDRELLEYLVRPFAEGGSMVILGDPNQQLTLRKTESALDSPGRDMSLTLDVNCRNTFEIARVAHSFTAQSVKTLETKSGIQIRTIEWPTELASRVKQEVLDVRAEFDPRSITVLTLTGISDLGECDPLFLDGMRKEARSARNPGRVEEHIPVFSAAAFQGRESDAVIAAINEKSLLKTYPFQAFTRDVTRNRELMERQMTYADLQRVEGQFERFRKTIADNQIPEFLDALKRDEPNLSERGREFRVTEFQKSRLLEFEPQFRDPTLEREWKRQQRRSLKIMLYSIMTRARVILSVISHPDATRFIEEQVESMGEEVAEFVDNVTSVQ